MPFKFETFEQTTFWLANMIGAVPTLGSVSGLQPAGLVGFLGLIWLFPGEWKIELRPTQASLGLLLFLIIGKQPAVYLTDAIAADLNTRYEIQPRERRHRERRGSDRRGAFG